MNTLQPDDSAFCLKRLQTLYTHDDLNILELAELWGEPGSVEAQAAVYEAMEGAMQNLMLRSLDAIQVRAEAFGEDGQAARRQAVGRHIRLLKVELESFLESLKRFEAMVRSKRS